MYRTRSPSSTPSRHNLTTRGRLSDSKVKIDIAKAEGIECCEVRSSEVRERALARWAQSLRNYALGTHALPFGFRPATLSSRYSVREPLAVRRRYLLP